MTELTHDAFLGGRLHLWQPKRGYRAGVDPVLLAASVPARPGDTLLELGCGVGAAMLCVMARVPGVTATGIEIQPDYAALAQRNGADVIAADLRVLPHEIRQRQFTHVIMNPPYFDRARGSASDDAGRDMAMAGDTPLADWLDVGIRRLAPGGYLSLIQHITRLPDCLSAVNARLGSLIVRPIASRAGRAPGLFLMQGRAAGRAPFRMLSPLILHEGTRHEGDSESYTKEVAAILRDGAALSFQD